MEFNDTFRFRRNITFFDQTRSPEKSTIEEILANAYDHVPVLQLVYPFKVDIYGPEYREEKKQLCIRSVCGPQQHDYRPGGRYFGQWDRLEEIFNEWEEMCIGPTGGRNKLHQGVFFNYQIMAPYLLVYKPQLVEPTQSQLDKGFIDPRGGLDADRKLIGHKWIGVSMHSYGVALCSADRQLHASFTKNWIELENQDDNPLLMRREHEDKFFRVPFYLGIGYQDERFDYRGDSNKGIKPDFSEIHQWK